MEDWASPLSKGESRGKNETENNYEAKQKPRSLERTDGGEAPTSDGSGNCSSSETNGTLTWFDVSCVVDTSKSDEIYQQTSLTEKFFYGTPLKKILSDQSGSVSPGESLAIMGSSGAGKTTLMNILAGRQGNTARAESRFLSATQSNCSSGGEINRSGSGVSMDNFNQEAPLLDSKDKGSIACSISDLPCKEAEHSNESSAFSKISGLQRCGEGVYGTVLGGGASFHGKGKKVPGGLRCRQTHGGVSYVVHEPILHPQFTVKQHLWFTLSLRLGQSASRQKKLNMIDKMARDLSLEQLLSAEIGGGSVGPRGLSGGERKLVQIAAESLTDPQLMFLDEPTSCLDASNATRVFEVLRMLQEARPRVIVYTIHQPRTRIFEMMDKLLVLAYGRTIYYGQASECLKFFETNGCLCDKETNPPDFIIDSISKQQKAMVIAEAFQRSSWKRKLDKDVSQAQQNWHSSMYSQNEKEQEPKRYAASFLLQLGVLLWRSWITFVKDIPGFFGSVTFLSTLATLIISYMFNNVMEQDSDARGRKVAALIVISQSFSHMFQAHVAYTMSLYQYECTMGTYHYLAFVAKEAIWMALHCVAFLPSAFVASLMLFDDLSLFPELFLVIYLVLLFDMFVLWFCNMCGGKNLSVGQTLMTLHLTFFFAVMGFVVPLPELPRFWKPFYYISPLQGAYSYMIVVLSGDSDDPRDLAFLQKTFGRNGSVPARYESILLILGWIIFYLLINTLYVHRLTRKNSINTE
eukprot:Nk52_evm64s207 gene=Nk52_evmTU64s207